MIFEDVIDTLAELFAMRGVPRHIRSDNGSEFIAQAIRGWLYRMSAAPANSVQTVWCGEFGTKCQPPTGSSALSECMATQSPYPGTPTPRFAFAGIAGVVCCERRQ